LTNDNGVFNFGKTSAFGGATALQDFLAGVANTTGNKILVGNATLSEPLNYNRYALFAQDDWRIRPRITLNLGVRYEYIQPVTTPNNVLGNFNAGAPTGLVQEVGSKAVYTLPKDLFSPRFGVAWDVTGKGTTVVRAGATYMHDFLVFQQLLPNLQNVPTGFALLLPNGTLASPQPGNNLLGTLAPSQLNWSGTGSVITLAPNAVNNLGFACGNGVAVLAGTKPAPCDLNPPVTPQNGFKPDGVVAWNLSVQHAFGNNLSLNVAYVGTHGEDLRGTTDINQPLLGISNGTSGELLRRPYTQNCPASFGGLGLNPAQCFPFLGQIEENLPNEISNYNGLQVTLNKRISHGLQFNAGYTYAHALDMASGLSNSQNNNLENTLNPWLDYGNASFDARHHLTITGTYDIPGYKMKGQMLQGWQVNVAATILSGIPFNAQDTTDDLSGTGILQDRWNILGDPGNLVTGTAAPVPCYGITGSKFAASGTGCTIVPAVANLPAQCLTAAGAAASNPSVPAANNAMGELGALGCYFQNGTALVPAAQGTYGNMGRNVLRGRPFKETDLSITKTWKFGERFTTQFRAEFFNIFNAVEFSNPGQSSATGNLASPAQFGAASSTPNTFSFIFGSGGPRTAQLGLKFLF
jgi:TonB dependent receptor-like, beta-barrel